MNARACRIDHEVWNKEQEEEQQKKQRLNILQTFLLNSFLDYIRDIEHFFSDKI